MEPYEDADSDVDLSEAADLSVREAGDLLLIGRMFGGVRVTHSNRLRVPTIRLHSRDERFVNIYGDERFAKFRMPCGGTTYRYVDVEVARDDLRDGLEGCPYVGSIVGLSSIVEAYLGYTATGCTLAEYDALFYDSCKMSLALLRRVSTSRVDLIALLRFCFYVAQFVTNRTWVGSSDDPGLEMSADDYETMFQGCLKRFKSDSDALNMYYEWIGFGCPPTFYYGVNGIELSYIFDLDYGRLVSLEQRGSPHFHVRSRVRKSVGGDHWWLKEGEYDEIETTQHYVGKHNVDVLHELSRPIAQRVGPEAHTGESLVIYSNFVDVKSIEHLAMTGTAFGPPADTVVITLHGHLFPIFRAVTRVFRSYASNNPDLKSTQVVPLAVDDLLRLERVSAHFNTEPMSVQQQLADGAWYVLDGLKNGFFPLELYERYLQEWDLLVFARFCTEYS